MFFAQFQTLLDRYYKVTKGARGARAQGFKACEITRDAGSVRVWEQKGARSMRAQEV